MAQPLDAEGQRIPVTQERRSAGAHPGGTSRASGAPRRDVGWDFLTGAGRAVSFVLQH
jgi:hypothetical protein